MKKGKVWLSINKLENLFYLSFLFPFYLSSRLNIHISWKNEREKSIISIYRGCATIYRISDIYHDGCCYLRYNFSSVVTIPAIILKLKHERKSLNKLFSLQIRLLFCTNETVFVILKRWNKYGINGTWNYNYSNIKKTFQFNHSFLSR